jgi:hypothetical protein
MCKLITIRYSCGCFAPPPAKSYYCHRAEPIPFRDPARRAVDPPDPPVRKRFCDKVEGVVKQNVSPRTCADCYRKGRNERKAKMIEEMTRRKEVQDGEQLNEEFRDGSPEQIIKDRKNPSEDGEIYEDENDSTYKH